MSPGKFNEQIATFIGLAAGLYKTNDADALLIMLEGRVDWKALKKKTSKMKVVLAADDESYLAGAAEESFGTIFVNLPSATIYEKLNQALLQGVSTNLLSSGSDVVAVYSAFEQEDGEIDSLSFFRLDERLGKLSARDLRQLETQVPLETLKLVVDLAVEIGREGREGKPVGTLIVVGDHRNVLEHSRTIGFDPLKGYKTAERNLRDPAVREDIKEIAQMDGAFIITAAGVVLAARQLLETGGTGSITLSKGLGTRHWAGAAISKKTRTVAVVVSESDGSVRIFQNGEVMLRIEPSTGPGRRAMTWKELDPTDPREDDKSDKKSASKKTDKDQKKVN
jgi:diadenylate cyclase